MHYKPIVVLFVGIPGSGKTTFARKLSKEISTVLLGSDSLRMYMWGSRAAIDARHTTPNDRQYANKLTFGALNYATNQIIESGNSVIYDCNANKRSERQGIYDIAAKHGAICVVVRIRVPYEVSMRRVQEREDTHDARQFSAEKAKLLLERFIHDIEDPSPDEPAVEINGEQAFEYQLNDFKNYVESLQILARE